MWILFAEIRISFEPQTGFKQCFASVGKACLNHRKKKDIPYEKSWEHRAGASFKECSETIDEAAAFYGQVAAVFSSNHFWGYDPSCEIQCDWAGGSRFSHYAKLAIFTTVPATLSAIYFNACGAESRESEHSRILILEDAPQALLNSVTCPNLQ